MPTFESILSDITQLPVQVRLDLIDAIQETIPDETPPRLSPEWLAEIERRSAAYELDPTTATDWHVVRDDVLARLQNRPG